MTLLSNTPPPPLSKNRYNSISYFCLTEQGRSMVEMFGILAIIAVLSIAGIKGFTIAMTRHRANQLLDGASKRAVNLSTQILMGKEDLSIGDFNNDTTYGTFGTPANNPGGGTFSIPLTDVEEDVCITMKSIIGQRSFMAISGKCGDDLTLCFNADLSQGVSIVNGNCVAGHSEGGNSGSGEGGKDSDSGSSTGSESSETGDNSGNQGENEDNSENNTGIGDNPKPNSCTDASNCPGVAQCVNGECVCNLTCSQAYTLLNNDSCNCVYCTSVHFDDITDVPEACCEQSVQDGGIGGEWNKQNDNLCHCPGKDEYWSKLQQQCLSPAPGPSCEQGQIVCNNECVTGDCCDNNDCTSGFCVNHTCQQVNCSGSTPQTCSNTETGWCCKSADTCGTESGECLCANGIARGVYWNGPEDWRESEYEECGCREIASITTYNLNSNASDTSIKNRGLACCPSQNKEGLPYDGAVGGNCCLKGTYTETVPTLKNPSNNLIDLCCNTITTTVYEGIRANDARWCSFYILLSERYESEYSGFSGSACPVADPVCTLTNTTTESTSDTKYYKKTINHVTGTVTEDCRCRSLGSPRGGNVCSCD